MYFIRNSRFVEVDFLFATSRVVDFAAPKTVHSSQLAGHVDLAVPLVLFLDPFYHLLPCHAVHPSPITLPLVREYRLPADVIMTLTFQTLSVPLS